DFTHGESRVQATVTLADYHAFKSLDTLTLTFFNFYIHDNGVTGAERRTVGFQLGIFNLLNDCVFLGHDSCRSSRPRFDRARADILSITVVARLSVPALPVNRDGAARFFAVTA